MVQHAQIKGLIAKLHATGFDDDALIVEKLYDELRQSIIKGLVARQNAEFYARAADLKMSWGE